MAVDGILDPVKDLYAVLGVDKTATLEELRKAYHALALQHHPDRNEGSQESEDKFREISSAYSVLSDERQRKRYDHEQARPAPRPAPGGTYEQVPAPNEDAWGQQTRKYEAVRNSYFYREGERRRAQNRQSSFRPTYYSTGVANPFDDAPGTGIQAPIELGRPVPIVMRNDPTIGSTVNVVHGPFGSLPGFFFFGKKA
jgi:DnaJ-class molecular chaperone